MKIYPLSSISFGILKSVKISSEGEYLKGKYKNFDIDIYKNNLIDARLIYISSFGKWIKSKLKYYTPFGNKTLRSKHEFKL